MTLTRPSPAPGTRALLDGMKGLITPDEGEALARMAAECPAGQAIVEVGAHRGLSSCWLTLGARDGHGAHLTSIDPWPLYGSGPGPDVPWAEEGALERWMENIAGVDGWPLVTPLRATGEAVAATWAKPVGLWFHDADHSYRAVVADFRAWLPYLAPGAWIAVHDYFGSVPDGAGGWLRDGSHQRAVEDVVLPSGRFESVDVIDNLWIGRRW